MRRCLAIGLISALCVAGSVQAVDIKQSTYLSSFTWRHKAIWFGGFSALELSDNGSDMTVLSDRTSILTARILRDGDAITGVDIGPRFQVRSSQNRVLPGWVGDSEGLAIDRDGTIYISFEGVHRVARYETLDGRSNVLPRPEAFTKLARNGSFEALAIDAQGRVYTMPESSRTTDGSIPVYRWDGKRWSTPFTLSQIGGFLPVGADFGPDGKLYVLERDASLIGFRSQIRRWSIDDTGVSGEEILLKTGVGTHDNLEGLSVWRDRLGRLRATMVSDDNFLGLQRTELVEYILPD